MIELVMRNYWWSRATRNVRRYIKEYSLFQRIKNLSETLAEKLIANKVLENYGYIE